MKCKVCKKRFTPKKENLYLAEERPSGLSSLTTAVKICECFDCPRCGCQRFVNVRIPKVEVEANDREEKEETAE